MKILYKLLLLLPIGVLNGQTETAFPADSSKSIFTNSELGPKQKYSGLKTMYDNYSKLSDTYHAEKVLEYIVQLPVSNSEKAEAYLNLAKLNNDKGLFDKAVENGFNALKFYESIKDTSNSIESLYCIGGAFGRKMDDSSALIYFIRAKNISESSIKKEKLALIYSAIGVSYASLLDFKKAEDNLKKAEMICLQNGNKKDLVAIYNNFSYLFYKQEKYLLMKPYLYKALHLIQESKDVPQGRLCSILTSLGDALTGEYNQTKKVAKLDSALLVFDSLLSFSRRNKLPKYIIGTYKRMSEVQKEKGNTDLAFRYLKLSTKIKDSVFTQERETKINELKTQYEVSKKESEIELLNEANINQKLKLKNGRYLIIIIALISLILILSLALINWRNKLKARKTALDLQHQLLRSQMNPHFIFNAINSIQRYVLDKDRHQAYNYLTRFSQLIRQVLDNATEKTIPLDRELETLKLYVEMEQLRFDTKFEFEMNVDPSVETESIFIPGMLIQPFVENAIWHGIMPLEGSYTGKISVDVSMQNKRLHIVISDNGIGRKKSSEIKKDIKHKSLGINLAKERLDILSSQSNQIVITDLFDEKTGESRGTQVEIII